jgi:hypothetical protein
MAMKKSIGRTLAHIDVAANTSVRIHEDVFNTHRIYQLLIQFSRRESTEDNHECNRKDFVCEFHLFLANASWG